MYVPSQFSSCPQNLLSKGPNQTAKLADMEFLCHRFEQKESFWRITVQEAFSSSSCFVSWDVIAVWSLRKQIAVLSTS
jgi:hypothetical protein